MKENIPVWPQVDTTRAETPVPSSMWTLLPYKVWCGHVPPEAAFFFEKYCLGRVVLCCFVFLLCCVALPFFLSISWMIKKVMCWGLGVM